VTTTDRDDFGRKIRLSSADTGMTAAVYDVADRLVLTVDASGNRTAHAYDMLGRVIHRQFFNLSRPLTPDEAHWRYEGPIWSSRAMHTKKTIFSGTMPAR
jgi:YD repeat-containing protein